ncbi:MAG: DegT/DnrJ/EryC1/StrS family aminotransferase [Desulfobulbaceae bacterium]|nr:DegT/DnrJ/EryC1/StrS family aminotransferase [Desulfobulbaceae bacterium]
MKAPHARYRLYTSWQSYLPFLKNVLLMSTENVALTTRFEEELCSFFQVKNVATVPMCRTAIYLTVKHLVQPGQDVVMSPYTIADVVNMVILGGGRPVFADIDRSNCNISVESIESLIHKDTGAVLVTHLHGVAAPIREICALCESKGIPVIEDTAQAFGAKVAGRRLGTFGDVGVYSLGMYKNINAWYGGIITCKNPELFAAIKQEADSLALQNRTFLLKRMLNGLSTDIATHPFLFRMFTFWIFRLGRLHNIRWINKFVETELDLSRRESVPATHLGKMTAAQHKLALLQLDHIDRDNNIRFEKAAKYREGLQGIAGMVFPTGDHGGIDEAIYTYFPIQYGNNQDDRQRLLMYFARHGCDIGPQHLKNCADLPAFKDSYRDCPNARQTAESVILLPTYPAYPDQNIEHNIAVLRDYHMQLSA